MTMRMLLSLCLLVASPLLGHGQRAPAAAPTRQALQARPSIQTATEWPGNRNLILISYDDDYLFMGRHFGSGKDPSGPTEPGLFVHSKAADRWLQITAISTVDSQLGTTASPEPIAIAVSWDFTRFADDPYIEQPMMTSGSIMLPDRIEYDGVTGRYVIRYASKLADHLPRAETVLYVARSDLDAAFASLP